MGRMTNAELARVFEQVADLMDIKGEDSFRVNSYRRVARAIEDCPSQITDLAARGELATLSGIGKGSAERISELLTTGRLALRDELLAEVPASLLELLEIQGVGPKKVALLWNNLGITSIAELKTAIDAGRLTGLKGFGEKSIAAIAHGIEFRQSVQGRVRLGVAATIAAHVKQLVRAIPNVQRVEHAGSLRRGRETVGDIDLLCIAADGPAVVAAFSELPGVRQVLARGDTKGSVQFAYAEDKAIQIDLRVVPESSFGAAWQYFSGSKEHNVRLRELAVKRGWSLNEYALTEGERIIASREEAEIYAALGLPWIPPELREDRGELTLRETPQLLELSDIRGDLHLHTTASDGKNSIEEMARAALERGYEYLCITDHSQSSFIANGLKPERLREHIAAVRTVAARLDGITLWIGAEVDILGDGRLDYDDDLLAELDWVVASVHQGLGQDIAANTRRTLAAIESPYVNVIAHPTGRLINKREPMPIDIEALAEAAARTGTALEINASTYRLDLKDQHARLAHERGVMICIDTDAHAVDQFDQMPFGVLTARRAGLTPTAVLNTRSAAEIRAFVERKRRNAGKR